MYISGEESLQQIKLRASRIGSFGEEMLLLCETSLETIQGVIERVQPEIVVIDSIQTMYQEDVSSAPGSVSQVREATSVFMQIAKRMGISIFIVGHVTKEGVVAGPRVLEHMVDTVLYFEGDRHAAYRILRGVKNRFGSTNEIGVFEMCQSGLKEVKNPSEYMLSGKPQGSIRIDRFLLHGRYKADSCGSSGTCVPQQPCDAKKDGSRHRLQPSRASDGCDRKTHRYAFINL